MSISLRANNLTPRITQLTFKVKLLTKEVYGVSSLIYTYTYTHTYLYLNFQLLHRRHYWFVFWFIDAAVGMFARSKGGNGRGF